VTAVLVVDVGGTNVKALVTGEAERRRVPSGPEMTPDRMVAEVLAMVEGWEWDVVSVGIPAPIAGDRVLVDPVNLGEGWAGFDFAAAFGKPTRVVNDAAMQALGSYEGGKMLFLGLGTGLGSAFAMNGLVAPMELGHLPYKRGTFESYVGKAGLRERGTKKWHQHVETVVAVLSAGLQPDYVVLGGGNAGKLDELPPNSRLGTNANAFEGGLRLWDPGSPGRIEA
jgi:predicted NBD/HSP70 family sugar kinase